MCLFFIEYFFFDLLPRFGFLFFFTVINHFLAVSVSFLNHKPCGHKIVVDHINNNKENDKLYNLQLISNRENTVKDIKGGTSKYTGVCWNKRQCKWQSAIQINGKGKHLGYFKSEKKASQAYQNELKKIVF